MTMTYEQVKQLTSREKYDLATKSYRTIVQDHPELEREAGRVAQLIVDETGLDFDTAVVVALSSPRG